MQRGSFQWMKSLNKSIILNKIRTSGPISRAQIAKETELTPPTVGSIVKELLEQQLIKESQLGESQGGRKPTMLVLHKEAFHIIGVDVGPVDIQYIISNLTGEIIAESKTSIDEQLDNQTFLDMLTDGIRQLMNNHSSLRYIGIGVAMHGIVDAETGVSLFAPNLFLRNIPIKEHLEQHFDMEVKVENDAKAFALGEAWFNEDMSHTSMIAVNIGRGIGAGLVNDGKLFNGANGIAGEIGHMMIERNGRKCSCGNDGCLQTIASGPAIALIAKEKLKSGLESKLHELVHSTTEITAETVHKAAMMNDKLSKEVFEEVGESLGIAFTNIIHTFNPAQIIIGGGVARAGELLLNPIRKTIASRAISERAKKTPVILSNLDAYGSSYGAVALILSDLFQPSLK
ncbi:glucokinase-like ROK family protein [Gracilibacillus halotolerans]|uniref:Glucokinase-like ROK family protein n=1 Tax=Gracilibacillus halotolerans TaxID=74386 RepID=A0A841RSZ5_9BACI|nr:ROK family transcriptional regulator [Gracilibacillus halotolerans]MBB6514436.1 glucokinase-like ROK family protein [Gracilibacillus halotolerans]